MKKGYEFWLLLALSVFMTTFGNPTVGAICLVGAILLDAINARKD